MAKSYYVQAAKLLTRFREEEGLTGGEAIEDVIGILRDRIADRAINPPPATPRKAAVKGKAEPVPDSE